MKVFIAICLVALVCAKSFDTRGRVDYKLLDDILESGNKSYIVAGKPAGSCEFPSIVYLFMTKGNNAIECDGTLIDATHVITAAHCVASGVERIKVYMGSVNHKFATFKDLVFHIVPHRHYYTTPRAQHNDIAILTLAKPVPFDDCIKPIPLAKPGASFEGQTCVTAGWGKKGWFLPTSDTLLKVSLPIMPYKECHRVWPYIGHEHICAGDWINGGPSPCRGDSGGPLYCKSTDGWVLAGIVSFGMYCEIGPAIYTNVAYFRDWIDHNRQ